MRILFILFSVILLMGKGVASEAETQIFEEKYRASVITYDDVGHVYKRERFFYNPDDPTQLISQAIDDGAGNVDECHTFRYDANGYIIEHTLWGNLTGNAIEHIHLNGMGWPINPQIEHYTTTFTYSGEGLLLSTFGDNGVGTRYAYDPHTKQLVGKFLCDAQGIRIRHFYSYDEEGNLAEQRVDDGISEDPANRAGVSEGQIHAGVKVDALNAEEIHRDQAPEAVVDPFGNVINYKFDAFGRKIATIHPEVLDGDNCPYRPEERWEFDRLDRMTSFVNGNGDVTQTDYNVRGQPIHVIHPDQTEERFIYALDGSLITSTSKNGSVTQYTRDYLGRPTLVEIYSVEGHLLYSTSKTYNASQLTSTTDGDGVTQSFTYDASGNPKTCQKGDQFAAFDYDDNGALVCTKMWVGNSSDAYMTEMPTTLRKQVREEPIQNEFHRLNDWGQQVLHQVMCDDNGIVSTLAYDAMGRPEMMVKQDPMGNILFEQEWRYDAVGNKVKETTAVIDPNGNSCSATTRWEYGPGKQLKRVIEAVDRIMEYTYNRHGQLESIYKANGTQLSHTYDGLGRLKRLFDHRQTIDDHYTYNGNHQIVEVYDAIHDRVTSRSFDENGNLIEETLGNGLTLKNQFDRLGRRVDLTLPDNSGVAYRYREKHLEKIHRLSSKGKKLYTHDYLDYDDAGYPIEAGLITTRRNEEGQVVEIQTPYWSEKLDNTGLEIDIHDAVGQTSCQYELNDLKQLISENDQEYTYDSIGNRLSKNGQKQIYDIHNQLISTGSCHNDYDQNGNLIKKVTAETTTEYQYDGKDRLTAVIVDGELIASYIYDAFDRRIAKLPFSGEDELYIYDGDLEIGSATADGHLTSLRVLGHSLGAEIGGAVALELNGKVYTPIHDHRGSVCALIDAETGETEVTYRYTAFGEEILQTAHPNPWRFSSKRCDPETGLIFFGKRYLNPTTGRFITQDPLGYLDGPNRYSYLHNNPLHSIDPFGLFGIGDVWNQVQTSTHNALTMTARFIHMVQTRYSLINYMRPEIEGVSSFFMGNVFLRMSGFYPDRTEAGVYGKGEFNDAIRVTFINGIMNTRNYYIRSLELLTETHGDINVHYVFKASQGWCWDLLHSVLVKFGYTSPQALLLAKTWKRLIQDMGGPNGGGIILHYAHSIGSGDTINAGKLLSPEERRMIRVITFGAASMVNPSHGFENPMNYISSCDGVAMLDPIGYLRGVFSIRGNVVHIPTWRGFPIFDHPLDVDSYIAILRQLGEEFLDEYPVPQWRHTQ